MSTHGIQCDPCCVFPADGKTVTKDLFELKPVADGVYAAVAAPQYKVNSNAAVILTNDGVVVVDSHSKPSAARALYQEIRGLTKHPVHTLINTHFHWDHWQGNEVYAEASSNLEIIVSERTRQNLTDAEACADEGCDLASPEAREQPGRGATAQRCDASGCAALRRTFYGQIYPGATGAAVATKEYSRPLLPPYMFRCSRLAGLLGSLKTLDVGVLPLDCLVSRMAPF